MWIMTTGGFVSAVQDYTEPDVIKVRARDRKSLEPLLEAISVSGSGTTPEIIVGEGTDYPYRVIISRADFGVWLAAEATRLDYTNFKDALKSSRGYAWADAASKIWYTLMSMVTDSEGYNAFKDYLWGSGHTPSYRRRQRDLETAFSVPYTADEDDKATDLAKQILGRVLSDVSDEPADEGDWFLDRDSRAANRRAQKRQSVERQRQRQDKARRYA